MTLLHCFCLAALLAGAVCAAQAQTNQSTQNTPELDFPQIWNSVRAASSGLKKREENSTASQLEAEAAAVESYPILSLNSSLGWQKNNDNPRQQHALEISASIWDFGRQSAQELRAQLRVKTSQAQSAEFESLLKGNAARLYVSLNSSQSIIRLAEEQIRNAKSKLNAVTSSYKRGERPQTDVVRMQVELGKAQIFFNKAQSEFDQLSAELHMLMTADASRMTSGKLRLKPLPERSEDEWQNLMSQWQEPDPNNPTLVRLRTAQEDIKAQLSLQRAEGWPQLKLGAGTQSQGELVSLASDFFTRLSFHYQLPLSPQRSLEAQSNQRKLSEAQLAFEEEQNNLNRQLSQSRVRIQGLLLSAALQKKQINTLRQYQKLTRSRYFAGKASLLEFTTTEDELLANELELSRIQFSLYSESAAVAQILGQNKTETLFE